MKKAIRSAPFTVLISLIVLFLRQSHFIHFLQIYKKKVLEQFYSFCDKMSVCTDQTLTLLKLISKSKKPKLILKKCSSSVIKTLCECAINVLRGNIPLTKSQKNRLSTHKRSLRKLSNKKIPLYKKRQLLVQRGDGFLSILLPTAISVISSLIHGAQ